MRVLITRPTDDAEELALQVKNLGHTPIIEPLLSIQFFEGPQIDVANCRALIFTSANGAKAASRRIADKTIPVIAIGPATARAARNAGFRNISQSNTEGVTGLEQFIRSTTGPGPGQLLHISGEEIAGPLVENLSNAGFTAARLVLYQASPSTSLSPSLYEALSAGSVQAALFFSPRTASTFSALIQAARCEQAMSAISALALSQNVAKSLSALTFRKLLVAQNQGTEAILKLLSEA